MKYYSDKTKKVYADVKALEAAETEWDKAHEVELKEKAAVKADADEIKKAYDELNKAREHYNDLVNKFIKKHKSYHLTVTTTDFFDNFFDNLFLF